MMPLDTRATSTVEETKPQCVMEQMDKILNTVIANSLKLMQMEASLRSQSVSVEQMANRIEDIADNTHPSLLVKELRCELRTEFNTVKELQLVQYANVTEAKPKTMAINVTNLTVIEFYTNQALPCYLIYFKSQP